MKKFLSLIFVLINLFIPLNTYANTSKANELINDEKENNLTINYSYDDYKFDKKEVKLYLIANIKSDFKYELTQEFKNYPISLNNIKENDEWNTIKETIDSYIISDNIKETKSSLIENNQVSFNNLQSGLYLIKTDTIKNDNYTLISDSIILNLPSLENGKWNYETSIYPKTYEFIPKYETIKYKVEKRFIDNKNNRPLSIDVEIFKDGNLFDSIILSSKNNWTYEWKYIDDGSSFSVVERNIPSNYNVSISKNNNNFIIINELKEDVKNPQTYDSINLYLYLLIISFIGIIVLLISLVKRRK